MVNRRTLLQASAGLIVGSALTGCSNRAGNVLRVLLIEGAVPSVVLNQFQRQADTPVKFQTVDQVQTAFQTLQRWQQPEIENPWNRFMPWRQADGPAATDDLVSLADYWLTEAIAQELIEPMAIPPATLDLLPTKWQAFGRRDRTGQIDPNGELWSVPYKLQSLVVIYRHSQFSAQSDAKQPFSSWQDLLASDLRLGIALPSHPNIIISLLRKLQTGSFNPISPENSANPAISNQPLLQSERKQLEGQEEQLQAQLAASFTELAPQVKLYDSNTALKALINEDVKAAVVWSGDAAVALKRYRDLRSVVPDEGSLLSADMWVQPKGTALSEAAEDWISFCWQQGPATELSIAPKGISPIFLATDQQIPEAIERTQLSLQALQNSELLLPLSESTKGAYADFWQQLTAENRLE
ncbi:extracellular solute-binding protein [cf. Phormidesmis sp. LEGE 11477]|uniref:extracellular solute-binding protein n=1 Tax=cf. Phormidesmis sp. LEGE 11477 TaxID=1828680 RepID=UPI00187DEC8C|nr:extracellular solute-binding protein [cf. Phormidesmis sp. LEGE 11477]MBE9062727.1 extracellular solute-binding protein [cf. Phormidesmis sp. LEGE 11477]